jgi:hypothetical protein
MELKMISRTITNIPIAMSVKILSELVACTFDVLGEKKKAKKIKKVGKSLKKIAKNIEKEIV